MARERAGEGEGNDGVRGGGEGKFITAKGRVREHTIRYDTID